MARSNARSVVPKDGKNPDAHKRTQRKVKAPSGHAAEAAPRTGAAVSPWAGFSQEAFERNAATLSDPRLSQPMYAQQRALIVQQLQRDYGNRYVQRLVYHIFQGQATLQTAGNVKPVAQARSAKSSTGIVQRERVEPVQPGRPSYVATGSSASTLVSEPTGGPVVQRVTRAKTGHPLADALEVNTTQEARNQLGEAVFQVLNRVRVAALGPFLHRTDTIALLQSLANNLGSLDAEEIAVVIGNLSPGMTAQEIAGLSVAQARFYSTHKDHIQLAKDAMAAAQNDTGQAETIVSYLMPYSGNARLLQVAKETLACVQNNVGQATAIMGYLSPYIADDKSLQVAKEALTGAQGNVEQAKVVMGFLQPYVALGDKVIGLARSELAKASNDPKAAKAEMDVLAKYNYDPQLRAGAQKKAESVAQMELEEATQKATRAKNEKYVQADQRVEDAQQKRPKQREAKAKRQWQEYRKGVEKAQTEAAEMKQEADKAEAAAIEQAKAEAQAKGETTRAGIETFIATASKDSAIGQENARWIIETTNFDVRLADLIVHLFKFSISKSLDPRPMSTWALGEAGNDAGRLDPLVRYLCAALDRGLDATLAQSVAGSLAKFILTPEQVGRLAEDAKKYPADWPQVAALVETHAARLGVALDVLNKARAVSVAVNELAKFIGKRSIEDVDWVLGQTGADLKKSEMAFDLLSLEGVNMAHLKKLLPKAGDVDTLDKLLNRVDYDKPNPTRLQQMLDKTDGATILSLLGMGKFDSASLKKHLVDDNIPGDKLTQLLAKPKASGAKITSLLKWTGNNADDLIALFKPNIDADILGQLYGSYSAAPPVRVVDAHLSKGSWDKGTFPTEIDSILYHFQKHVIDEAGPAPDVAAYTADALALNNDGTQPRAPGPDGSTLVGGHGRRGGYFKGGKILTFWYR